MGIEADTIEERIVNKQFEMAGIDFSYKQIPADGLIKVGKKDVLWYNIYRFPNEEMYIEWREWADEQARGVRGLDMNVIDLNYGMSYKY